MAYVNGSYTNIEPSCLVECSYNTSRGIGRVTEKVKVSDWYCKWMVEWSNGDHELMHDAHLRKVTVQPKFVLRSIA